MLLRVFHRTLEILCRRIACGNSNIAPGQCLPQRLSLSPCLEGSNIRKQGIVSTAQSTFFYDFRLHKCLRKQHGVQLQRNTHGYIILLNILY